MINNAKYIILIKDELSLMCGGQLDPIFHQLIDKQLMASKNNTSRLNNRELRVNLEIWQLVNFDEEYYPALKEFNGTLILDIEKLSFDPAKDLYLAPLQNAKILHRFATKLPEIINRADFKPNHIVITGSAKSEALPFIANIVITYNTDLGIWVCEKGFI